MTEPFEEGKVYLVNEENVQKLFYYVDAKDKFNDPTAPWNVS